MREEEDFLKKIRYGYSIACPTICYVVFPASDDKLVAPRLGSVQNWITSYMGENICGVLACLTIDEYVGHFLSATLGGDCFCSLSLNLSCRCIHPSEWCVVETKEVVSQSVILQELLL